MSQKIIEAAKAEDPRALEILLAEGADVNEQDEQGWHALSWAAGRGDVASVRLLIEHGADVLLGGRDRRSPRMIAEAARQREVAQVLAEAEERRGLHADPQATQPYCRAYYLRDLRRFPGWREKRWDGRPPSSGGGGDTGGQPLGDRAVVYLHRDLTVTRSMWHGENVIFDAVTRQWRQFCETELGFAVPEDLG